MPIYEYYCEDCHTVYNFFARTMNTTQRPSCPDCGRQELERQVSRFAISRGRSGEEPQEDEVMGPDDEKIAQALQQLAAEHDKMDHDDPCHAIPMIQKVYEIAGMPLPEKAREAISRLDAGEDIETVDAEFGDLWFSEDSPFAEGMPLHRHFDALAEPRVDEKIYDL